MKDLVGLSTIDLAKLSKAQLFELYKKDVANGTFEGSYKVYKELVRRGGFELER